LLRVLTSGSGISPAVGCSMADTRC
jgi:hypothetical protein